VATGKLLSKTETISFAGSGEDFTCDFNGGANNNSNFFSTTDATKLNSAQNGIAQEGRIRARFHQESVFNLPTAGTICDLKFTFPETKMEYDDEIFLTINNYVVMSSQNYSLASGAEEYASGLKINEYGLMEYNWLPNENGNNGLYNLKYGQKFTPKYCLGVDSTDEEKCSIPPTQKEGILALDIPSKEIIKLGIASTKGDLNSNEKTQMNFGFITIGDNEPGDCEASPYHFDVEVWYVE
jgi:hypothetical protein